MGGAADGLGGAVWSQAHRAEREGASPRQRRRVVLFAWGAWFTGFASLMLPSFLLAPIQEELSLSESGLALLTGVGVGATGLGGLLFGWMSDRLGRRASLALAVGSFCLGNAGCALAPRAGWLVLVRAIAGLGIGGTWGAGQAMIGETFPASHRGRAGAIGQSGAPCGLGAAAAAGSFLAPAIGWRWTFLLSALPIAALAGWHWLPESDLWREHRRRLREESLTEEMVRARRPVLAQLLAADLVGLFAKTFVLTGLNMSAYWFAVVWLPRYLQKEQGLSIFGSGWWTLTFVAGSLAGYLSFGLLSDAIGRRPAFTLYCALSAASLSMVLLAPGVPFMFLAGVGTGTWSCYGAYFSELFPTRVRGTAMSLIMNVTRGVQFLAPVVIAAIAGRWGLSGGVGLAAAFAALAGVWVWTLPETAGSPILP